MMERPSAIEPAPTLVCAESALAAAERAIREADPAAFPVASRIVRRVIRHEFDLPALIARVPHRKSFHLPAERARQIVAHDELGLENGEPLPEIVILLARPEEHELETMTAATLREHMRRLHFHARVHVALDERRAAGLLDERAVRERIERIGYTAFDEARTVLAHEAFLLPPADVVSEYVEFAAVFFELRYFAPDVLASYFPSLDDIDRAEAIMAEDVDTDAILDMTAELAGDEAPRPDLRSAEQAGTRQATPRRVPRLPQNYQKLLRDAERAAKRGNDVRAAILHARAAEASDPALATRAAALAAADIRRLAQRLRRALKSEESGPDPWRDLLAALLERSTHGFWNASARLLYDLQKVCLDSERESYVVDLLSWLLSFGRRPLKRPLPAQREVLLSKHLRVATSRVAKIAISAGEREHLATLLRAAAVAAEHRLRERLRPPLEQTLNEVGFVPQNLPERVSFRKMVEELLDEVVERGFFAMGDIRDAIARSNLKLDDVADPLELVAGDRLLRADRRLADVLDGVYQRGAIYLRGLQRLSSCAFRHEGGPHAHVVRGHSLRRGVRHSGIRRSPRGRRPAFGAVVGRDDCRPRGSVGASEPAVDDCLGTFDLGIGPCAAVSQRHLAGAAARRTGTAGAVLRSAEMAGGSHLHQPPVAQSRLSLFPQAAADVARAHGTFLLAVSGRRLVPAAASQRDGPHFRGPGGRAQFAAGP